MDRGDVVEPNKPRASSDYSVLTHRVSSYIGLDRPPPGAPSGGILVVKEAGSRGRDGGEVVWCCVACSGRRRKRSWWTLCPSVWPGAFVALVGRGCLTSASWAVREAHYSIGAFRYPGCHNPDTYFFIFTMIHESNARQNTKQYMHCLNSKESTLFTF